MPEWEKTTSVTEPVRQHDFTELNKVAIIRLSNALLGKLRKYRETYKRLDHVKGKPFVIAIAPFEQPSFQHQYDRPIRALLYDDYVDETAFYKSPQDYPNGPPSISLGHVEKPNGATIDLGIFNSDEWSEVSAVIFSCVATWGKTVALSNVAAHGWVFSSWGTEPNGKPALRRFPVGQPSENITDGLQVFHNAYARYPVSLEFFRREGVVQHYVTPAGPVRENYDNCLQTRSSISLKPTAPIAAPERQEP